MLLALEASCKAYYILFCLTTISIRQGKHVLWIMSKLSHTMKVGWLLTNNAISKYCLYLCYTFKWQNLHVLKYVLLALYLLCPQTNNITASLLILFSTKEHNKSSLVWLLLSLDNILLNCEQRIVTGIQSMTSIDACISRCCCSCTYTS